LSIPNRDKTGKRKLHKELRKLHKRTNCFGKDFTEYHMGRVIEGLYFRNVKAGSQVLMK
jgi:hypothetical protein